jgi:hypothetical protein
MPGTVTTGTTLTKPLFEMSQKVRAVRIKGLSEFDMTVTTIKDPETPFPTIMLQQGDQIIAVPVGMGAALSRAMHESANEFLRGSSGGIIIKT